MIFSSIDLKNTKTLTKGRKCKWREGVKVGDTKCFNCACCHLVVPNDKTSSQAYKVKCMAVTIQRNVELWRRITRMWASQND